MMNYFKTGYQDRRNYLEEWYISHYTTREEGNRKCNEDKLTMLL
jgi:hypothetical protein